jgi:mono/diheme cytochrome c family protein
MKKSLQIAMFEMLGAAGNLAIAETNSPYADMTGKELYKRFCASCHGLEAHGDGPVAPLLKVQVPDLTLIELRHKRFDAPLIEMIIDGRFLIRGHGTRDMPVWGDEFTRSEIANPQAESATRVLIRRMVEYLQSIQQSPRGAVH